MKKSQINLRMVWKFFMKMCHWHKYKKLPSLEKNTFFGLINIYYVNTY